MATCCATAGVVIHAAARSAAKLTPSLPTLADPFAFMLSLIAVGVKRVCISHCGPKDESGHNFNVALAKKVGAGPTLVDPPRNPTHGTARGSAKHQSANVFGRNWKCTTLLVLPLPPSMCGAERPE